MNQNIIFFSPNMTDILLKVIDYINNKKSKIINYMYKV